MLLRIGDILSAHEIGAIIHTLEQVDYQDGRRTAGWHARDVKRNEQAVPSPALDAVLAKVPKAPPLAGDELPVGCLKKPRKKVG